MDPIYLRINRRNSFDLTLVDLPGLVADDDFSERVIKAIYKNYINKEKRNVIPLLVSAAEGDFAAVNSQKFVRHEDAWDRTLTIITKVDRRDENYLKFNYEKMNLGLGTYFVRNRTLAEVEANMSYEETLSKEREVLAHSDFDAIPADQKGILNLI